MLYILKDWIKLSNYLLKQKQSSFWKDEEKFIFLYSVFHQKKFLEFKTQKMKDVEDNIFIY